MQPRPRSRDLPREIASRGGSAGIAGSARDGDESCPGQNKRRGAEASAANGAVESDEGREDRVQGFSSAADQTISTSIREALKNV
jgi:hypothetical protein